MRPTTIYAAILAEHGNADELSSRPLTCYVCGDRPSGVIGNHLSWYVTDADPLPAGWQEITSDVPPAVMRYCPSCYEDRAEGRELELDY